MTILTKVLSLTAQSAVPEALLISVRAAEMMQKGEKFPLPLQEASQSDWSQASRYNWLIRPFAARELRAPQQRHASHY